MSIGRRGGSSFDHTIRRETPSRQSAPAAPTKPTTPTAPALWFSPASGTDSLNARHPSWQNPPHFLSEDYPVAR